MEHLSGFFFTGAALGLASGLTPGPLQLLILAQTMAHGPREGSKVAMAPLLTDVPVMLACLLALTQVADLGWFMGLISIAGGCVVLRFGWGCVTSGPVDTLAPSGPAGSWRKGVATNALNPKMILFWATVGAPTLLAAIRNGWTSAAAFLLAFYAGLVGVSISLAWLSARFTAFLSGTGYVWVMRGLGSALLALAVGMIWDGVGRF